jgi:CRP-like cAMP-binding protein
MAVARLERHHVFELLREEQVDALSDASVTVSLKAGEEVYRKGDDARDFYIVLRGQVALRLPGRGGVSILIDEVTEGALFGTCVSLTLHHYMCSAQCTKDSELLRIRADALKDLLDDDPRMGYAIQSHVAKVYFERYMETMKKLQAIVMNIPIEADGWELG